MLDSYALLAVRAPELYLGSVNGGFNLDDAAFLASLNTREIVPAVYDIPASARTEGIIVLAVVFIVSMVMNLTACADMLIFMC